MIRFLDLNAIHEPLTGDLRAAFERVLASGRFILGPEVEALEREIAERCGAEHGVGVASGSDALLLALLALGVGPGDEVITSPFSFFATAGSIVRLGATPVFVDIDPRSFNLDPERFEAAITERTAAVVPVHLFGRCTESAVWKLAAGKGLPVVEDAAQAIGAELDGHCAGSSGTLACLSFFPSKNLGGLGDGGMVLSTDAELASRVRELRTHGRGPREDAPALSGNHRLDELQAALLRVKLTHLDDWTAARQGNAARYDRLFVQRGLTDKIRPPARPNSGRHVFHQYVIRSSQRDALRAHLAERAIETQIYYSQPLHRDPRLAGLWRAAGELSEAERAASEVLALPVYPGLPEGKQRRVVDAIVEFYA